MSDSPIKRKKKTTIARENRTSGYIEIIDKVTGEIVAYQSSAEDLLDTAPEKFSDVKSHNGKMVKIEKGLDVFEVLKRTHVPVNDVTVDILCQRVAEGRSITDVCHDKDMPKYYTLMTWIRAKPEYRQLLEMAKDAKAELMFDKAMAVVDEVKDKDDVAIGRLKHDVFKYGAQILRPKEYSPQKNVKAEVAVASRIVIETGVRRDGDEGFFVDETAKLALDQVREVEEDNPLEGENDGKQQAEDNDIKSTASVDDSRDSSESSDILDSYEESVGGSSDSEHGNDEGSIE